MLLVLVTKPDPVLPVSEIVGLSVFLLCSLLQAYLGAKLNPGRTGCPHPTCTVPWAEATFLSGHGHLPFISHTGVLTS